MRFVIAPLGWKIQNLGFRTQKLRLRTPNLGSGIEALHQNTETFGRQTPLLRLGTQTEQ